jgi:hypothetical protein
MTPKGDINNSRLSIDDLHIPNIPKALDIDKIKLPHHMKTGNLPTSSIIKAEVRKS